MLFTGQQFRCLPAASLLAFPSCFVGVYGRMLIFNISSMLLRSTIFSPSAQKMASSLDLPPGLICLLLHDHGHGYKGEGDPLTNSQKRKFIYRTLYQSLVPVLGKRGTYIYPDEVLHIVRNQWPDEDKGSGKYDGQVRPGATKVTRDDLLKVDWGPCHCTQHEAA